MSTKNGDRNPPREPRRGGTNVYEVGYGKPPRTHQFKPGKSGNPKGRRKGARNQETIVLEILDRPVEIVVGGKRCKVTVPFCVSLGWRRTSPRLLSTVANRDNSTPGR